MQEKKLNNLKIYLSFNFVHSFLMTYIAGNYLQIINKETDLF